MKRENREENSPVETGISELPQNPTDQRKGASSQGGRGKGISEKKKGP